MKKFLNLLKKPFSQNKQSTNFVIISTQRSGTTYLTQLLNSHTEIHMGSELFKMSEDLANVDDDNYRYAEKNRTAQKHLNDFYLKYGKSNLAVGFTLMHRQLMQNPKILSYIKENNILCIYLERENQLKTVISRLKARDTSLYHTTKNLNKEAFEIDLNSLVKELDVLDKSIIDLRALVKELPLITVTYESLQQNQDNTLKTIQEFLNLPYQQNLSSTLKKTNSDNLQSIIKNYSEVEKVLQATSYNKYLPNQVKKTNTELVGTDGGAWDEETHMKLHAKNFNKGLAEFIVHKICPKNSLEFGSGLGFLARYIVDNSNIDEAYCIEPNDIKGHYRSDGFPKLLPLNIFDDTIPQVLDKKFDLVYSIEVAEHVEREKHTELFDFLTEHADNWIVFSGARVGQGGLGHIAERPQEEWREEFTSRGFEYLSDMSNEIRLACDKKNINHQKNLMIFKKKS